MKLLIDQNLSQQLSNALNNSGYEAFHTSQRGLAFASDTALFAICREENLALVTGDIRLTKYLASEKSSSPTVIIARNYLRDMDMLPDLLAIISVAQQIIVGGDHAVISLSRNRPARIRILPLGPTPI